MPGLRVCRYYSSSYVLTDMAPVEFMGLRCLKRTYAGPGSSVRWLVGQPTYIPLDKILTINEFESLNAYTKSAGAARSGKLIRGHPKSTGNA
jgi:hypothetical protein